MASHTTHRPFPKLSFDAERRHRLRLHLAILAAVGLFAALAIYGLSYYQSTPAERVYTPLHDALRPSGSIGLRLGMLGGVLFLGIYLYPIRKRWPWLRKIGNTRHWLDFHVFLGVTAPILITFHSSFKMQGLAGMAYWIMWTVVMSGFVGRYFYGQIPRRMNAAEMSLKEMEGLGRSLAQKVAEQDLLTAEEIAFFFRVPTREEVQGLSLFRALFVMFWLDLTRPFRFSKLRRKSMGTLWSLLSLGGLLPFAEREIEEVITAIRRQSWLSTKIVFLDKTQQVFHLWHVVHRPFSYSFAVLVVVHVAVVMLLGYF